MTRDQFIDWATRHGYTPAGSWTGARSAELGKGPRRFILNASSVECQFQQTTFSNWHRVWLRNYSILTVDSEDRLALVKSGN
jgi:hypothetical protein